MRITSGIFKSRIIKAPAGIRPTLDNVRKAIFDILGGEVEGAKTLDLFAGSGAMGIEALSRGAASCIFVDNGRASIKVIKENIMVLNLDKLSGVEVTCADSFKAIERFGKAGNKFDFIFIDPPYYKELAKKSLSLLAAYDILAETGVAVIEHSKHDEVPESCGHLKFFRTTRYGDTRVSFYCKD